MAGSDKYKLPTDYKLGAVAEKVALDLHLQLQEVDNDSPLEVMIEFANLPQNLVSFILGRGEVTNPLMLLGELENKALLHYTGGISKAGNVCESLYVNNSKRVIGVTFGVPENYTGSLFVLDLAGSIALQKLSGAEPGHGGLVCVYHPELPKPEPLKGAAQFEDFSKVYETISRLLE